MSSSRQAFSIFQKRSSSNGNMSSSVETSSKSKPTDDVDIDSDSSSDVKISKLREVVPAKPPQARVISGFTPEKEEKEKKEKKVKKSDSTKKKSVAKAVEEGGIEPAPQILFAAGDEEVVEKKKKKTKKSKDGKKKKGKKYKKSSNAGADAQSFVPSKLARSTERFDDSKSVVIKRNPALANANVGKRPQISDPKGIAGLARSQFQFEPKPLKKDITDDPYVTILTIPTDAPEVSRPKSVTKPKPQIGSSSSSKGSSRLPLPNFSSLPSGTDGLKPLETMAETMEMQTNAFNQEKYEAAPVRRYSRSNEDLLQPITGWLKFQVPIIPKPDDVEYEREATKQFDISRLLHQAKTC